MVLQEMQNTCEREHQAEENLYNLKVSSLNCRGMQAGESKTTKRMFHLDIRALQQTTSGGYDPEEIITIDGKCRLMVYHSRAKEKNKAGVAMTVRKGTNVTFREIKDRRGVMKI